MDRLQKVIAASGLCSRRKAEEWILAGRVEVNGQVVRELGVKVDPQQDEIRVDGALLTKEPFEYYALNKPLRVVSTAHDPRGRTVVTDLVPTERRIYPVGRLDYDTEGLLLLTNDGELTYRLTHPSFEVEKVYLVDFRGRVGAGALERLRRGVELEDGPTQPARADVVEQGKDFTRVQLAIHEGRNRQVRRMGDAIGHRVVRLRRIRFGPIDLGSLSPGESRALSSSEIQALKRLVGLFS